MDDITQDTVDYIALRRLQDSYADIVTRRAWAELHDIFAPDVDIVVDARKGEPFTFGDPDGIGGFIRDAIAHFDFFEFVILNAVVWLHDGGDADQAVGRMYINELRREHTTGEWTLAYGVYHDRYTRVDGRWWFTRRRYHSLARTPPESAAFEFPTGDLW